MSFSSSLVVLASVASASVGHVLHEALFFTPLIVIVLFAGLNALAVRVDRCSGWTTPHRWAAIEVGPHHCPFVGACGCAMRVCGACGERRMDVARALPDPSAA